MPQLPEGLTARPLTPEDVDAAAALLAAAEPLDRTGEHEDADDLREWWVNDRVDLRSDGLAVCGPDGDLAGWATAVSTGGVRDGFRVWLEGRVHPAHRGRGIGRCLLDWQVGRGAELHRREHPEAEGRLLVSVSPAMTALEGLVRRAGFTPERWYSDMERPLTGLPEVPAVPGVELVPFTWDRDEEVRLAHNTAFAGHFGSLERDEVSWRAWFTGQKAFRPELSVLALADGAVIGYVLAYVFDADTRATGARQSYLGQIGVLPGARGQGIASVAIAAALRAAAVDGCATAGLQVDTANATGAPALYRRMGFATVRTRTEWAYSLSPVG
ncbi:GNAT family N-acetyltransferase [Geodermatophilus sabuli]|uniref:Ribosomal protein S18 acetylase RimI n=1 Tax=Geodermatophilus sabuli TaxID=1564158 RepID=A0A285E5T7_9ACTN|nr:GNAT family N-acetyltransferase [Geodermatophilus sabuli]MBB3082902.1 ribosomal protein S18 acetylase RimI-like enzyme [Geodermatophilus sabuli]SNX94233.1 Ribosomal protein S18 acetylase RimI [Geodermatophilus sabuli]